RSQESALYRLKDLLDGEGEWARAFTKPDAEKFSAPTVTDVAYPKMGFSVAWNDPKRRVLELESYVATTGARGDATRFTVRNLPDASRVAVLRDGRPQVPGARPPPARSKSRRPADSKEAFPQRGLLLDGVGRQRRHLADHRVALLDDDVANPCIGAQRRVHICGEHQLDREVGLVRALGENTQVVACNHPHEPRLPALYRDIIRYDV